VDAPVTSTRGQQHEQPMAWVAVVLNDFPCFPQESCGLDVLRCLHQPLEGFPIRNGAAAKPGSNAVREDALNGAPVNVSEFLHTCQIRHAKPAQKALLGSFYSRVHLPEPGEAILDKHSEELEAGDFLHFTSVNV